MYKLILEKSSLFRTSFSIFLELLVGRLIKNVGNIQKKEVITLMGPPDTGVKL